MPISGSTGDTKQLKAKLGKSGQNLVAVSDNLVDLIWNNRPPIPARPAFLHDLSFSGQPAQEKLEKLASDYRSKGCAGYLATALDEIACENFFFFPFFFFLNSELVLMWTCIHSIGLLNLRGSDIDYNPVFFSYFALTDEHGPVLFIDPSKIEEPVGAYLASIGVKTLPYESVTDELARYGAQLKTYEKVNIWLDCWISLPLCLQTGLVNVSPLSPIYLENSCAGSYQLGIGAGIGRGD
jgi:Xaa-Pro aminopeptidase